MAVLKRFSYDNIVEHNPNAPDPVDYEGGGEGGGDGGSWKYYVVHSEDFTYLYLKDSAGNFVSYDQFINDIAAVAFVDASHESGLGDIVRSYQLMYFADITADPGGVSGDVRFFWPGRNNGTAVTLINFRSIDGKLRAAMPL